jgi:transcriptional regulator with XRE-family HTH domain
MENKKVMLDNIIGTVVRKIRQNKNMTHEELSEKSKLAIVFIPMIEEGRFAMDRVSSIKVAEGLGLSYLQFTNIVEQFSIYFQEEGFEILRQHLVRNPITAETVHMHFFTFLRHLSTRDTYPGLLALKAIGKMEEGFALAA